MTGLILDTHTCIWYLARDVRLSQLALQAIRDAVASEDRCYVPSICLVETTYLAEKGRIPESSHRRLLEALDAPNRPGLKINDLAFKTVNPVSGVYAKLPVPFPSRSMRSRPRRLSEAVV